MAALALLHGVFGQDTTASPLSPEDTFFGWRSPQYTSYVEDMCAATLVQSMTCFMDEFGFVIGLSYADTLGQTVNMCQQAAAYTKDIMCNPGESIAGMRVCRGKRGGIKRIIFVKDSGEEASCGNEDASWAAYEYMPFPPAQGRKLQTAEDASSNSVNTRGTSTATWWESCSFLSTARFPRWATKGAKPWYAQQMARGKRYRVNGRVYKKSSWVGPYSNPSDFLGFRPILSSRSSYEGYYSEVFPLAYLSADCAYVGGPIKSLTARYTNCYTPPCSSCGGGDTTPCDCTGNGGAHCSSCGGGGSTGGSGGSGSSSSDGKVVKIAVLADVAVACQDLDTTANNALIAGVQSYMTSVLQGATLQVAPAYFDAVEPVCDDHDEGDAATAIWTVYMDVVPADATFQQLLQAVMPLDGKDYCTIAEQDLNLEPCDSSCLTELVYRVDSEPQDPMPAPLRYQTTAMNKRAYQAVLMNVYAKSLGRQKTTVKSAGPA